MKRRGEVSHVPFYIRKPAMKSIAGMLVILTTATLVVAAVVKVARVIEETKDLDKLHFVDLPDDLYEGAAIGV